MFQVIPRVPLRQSEYKDKTIHGVFIVSHDNKNTYKSRCKNPFTRSNESYAKTNKICLATVVDLINVFLDIKAGIVMPEALIKVICTPGILKNNWAQYKLEQ